MKVCIYGAGAIGGWIGVRLATAGHDVSVIARGTSLEAISTVGLTLMEGDAAETAHVHASQHARDLGEQDLVVVAVKAPAMASVAAGIGPLIGPRTRVLTAMNGVPWWFCAGLDPKFARQQLASVDPDGSIARAIPSSQVIGCVVHASCLLSAPGVVRHHQGNRLIVGNASRAASGNPSAEIRTVLESAGFAAEGSDFIQRDVWYKLWGNMTMNPISALTGATTDRILNDELARAFVTSIMLEAKEIGARLGIPIDQQPEDRHATTLKLGAMETSMLQDVKAGRAVELDALVGTVRELGAMTSVPTPFTDALMGLARLQARTLGLYPG